MAAQDNASRAREFYECFNQRAWDRAAGLVSGGLAWSLQHVLTDSQPIFRMIEVADE